MINERIANKQFCSVLIHPQSACWSHSAQHSSIPACSQRLVHSRSCSSSDVAHPPPFRSAHCSTAWHAPLYNSVIQAFFFLPQHTSEIMSVSSFLTTRTAVGYFYFCLLQHPFICSILCP